MKSVLIFVSSFLLVAAVHGSAILETRDNGDIKDQVQGNNTQNPQSGSGIFSIHSNCDASSQGTNQTGSGIPIVPATTQSSNGTTPSQGPPPICFNLTDPTGSQPSVVVQSNNASPAQGAQGTQPPSNQTATPNSDNNSSAGNPQFQFCPSSDDGSTPPFTNGTSVNFQQVQCPCAGSSDGTLPGGGNGGNQDNSTLQSGNPNNSSGNGNDGN